jgi:hypothetical protein
LKRPCFCRFAKASHHAVRVVGSLSSVDGFDDDDDDARRSAVAADRRRSVDASMMRWRGRRGGDDERVSLRISGAGKHTAQSGSLKSGARA